MSNRLFCMHDNANGKIVELEIIIIFVFKGVIIFGDNNCEVLLRVNSKNLLVPNSCSADNPFVIQNCEFLIGGN